MRLVLALALCGVLNACTPQAALLASVLPGPVTALLGKLERVDDRNLRRVAELERSARWNELASLADEHLAKNRSNADWWLIKGYAHAQLTEHSTAAAAFGEAVRLEPDSAAGWNLLAQAYRSAGQPERAVNALNNALLGLRDTTMSLFLLGESYGDLRRFQDAAGAYREAITREPKFAAAWFGLARSYGELGRVEQARAAKAQLERLDPALAARLR